MSREAMLQFCKHIAESKELQEQIQANVQQGKTLVDFVTLGKSTGYEFSLLDADEVFEEERIRRTELESGEHAETVIVKSRRSEPDDEDQQGMSGFRRVALSMDWQLGVDEESDSESIFD